MVLRCSFSLSHLSIRTTSKESLVYHCQISGLVSGGAVSMASSSRYPIMISEMTTDTGCPWEHRGFISSTGHQTGNMWWTSQIPGGSPHHSHQGLFSHSVSIPSSFFLVTSNAFLSLMGTLVKRLTTSWEFMISVSPISPNCCLVTREGSTDDYFLVEVTLDMRKDTLRSLMPNVGLSDGGGAAC